MTIVAVVALVGAIAAVAWAWLVTRAERRRSEARVAALAAVIDPPRQGVGEALFAQPPVSTPAAHPLLTIASGFVVVVAFIVLAAMTAELRQPGIVSPLAAAGPVPPSLGLLSMGHERTPNGLTVSGAVRHASAGAPRDLTAVVTAFSRAGRLVGTGEARLEPDAAQARRSSFAVEMAPVAEVARYRVSFRSESGIIRHVDLRSRTPERTRAAAGQ